METQSMETQLSLGPRAGNAPCVLASDSLGGKLAVSHRILIVEDDVFVGVQYEDALTDAGYHVVDIVPTAEEAVEASQDHKPALVIMDIRLAGPRDGVDAAVEIFKRFGIRTIFASAYSDPDTHVRAEGAQPFAWLPKPVSPQRLLATVQAALEDLEDGSGSPPPMS